MATAAKKTTAKKTAAKSTAAKKTSAKSTTAKKTTAKTSSTAVKLTAAEKKLVEYYRKADASAKKQATELLKSSAEDDGGILGSLLGGKSDLKDTLLDAAKNILKDSLK